MVLDCRLSWYIVDMIENRESRFGSAMSVIVQRIRTVMTIRRYGSYSCSKKLKYITFVEDGDSSTYDQVKEALEEKFGSD